MYFKCCVPGCVSSRLDVTLHKFPKCTKRLKKWLDSINCDSLRKEREIELQALQVCHKHFEKRFVTKKSRILSIAYPTLFLQSEIASGIPLNPSRACETKDPAVEHSYVKKVHIDHNYYSTRRAQNSQSQKQLEPRADAAVETNLLIDADDIPESVVRVSKRKLPDSDAATDAATDAESRDANDGSNDVETNLSIDANDIPESVVCVSKRKLPDSDDATDAETRDANDGSNDVGMHSSDEELYEVECVSMFDDDGDATEPGDHDIIISGDPTAETNLLIVGNDIPENVVRVSKRKLSDSDAATDAESRDANEDGDDVGMHSSDEELYDVEYLSMFDDNGDMTGQGNHDIIISDPKYSNAPSREERAGEPAGQEGHEGEVHEGTACSVCKGAVRGFRYTCIECVYELCRVCEALGAHAHHHVLRVPCPRPYGEVESVVEHVRKALRCGELARMDFEEARCDATDTMSVKSMRTECDPFSDVRSERSAGAFPDSDTESQADFEEKFRRPPTPPPPRPTPAAAALRRDCAGAVSATPDSHVTRTLSSQDYIMKGIPAIPTTPAIRPGHVLTHGHSQTGQYTQLIADSKTDQPSCTQDNMNVNNSVDVRGKPCATLVLVLPPKLANDTVRRKQVLEMITTELRNQDALQRLHKLNETQSSDAESSENRRGETSFTVIAR